MLESLERHCKASLSWNVPDGGMFFWARTQSEMDTAALLEATLAPATGARVAFVPGAPFFAGQPDASALRLSFVTVPPPRIEEGVAQLARALRKFT